MTAAVVVMNSLAIAMAADTAVSIPHARGMKTYTKARKLVPLDGKRPIAMMVWDAPDAYGLPWEVIATDFRAQSRNLTTLDEAVNQFFDHVDRLGREWVALDHEETLVTRLLAPVAQALQAVWVRAVTPVAGGPALSAPERAKAAEDVPRSFIKDFQPIFRYNWRALASGDLVHLDSQIDRVFASEASGPWAVISPEMRAALIELGRARLLHVSVAEGGSSGLIFAGFGDSEIFGQARVWRVSGRLDGRTRRVELDRLDISTERPSVIKAVAQEGVIRSFLDGIHPEVVHYVEEMIRFLGAPKAPGDAATTVSEQFLNEFATQLEGRRADVERAVAFLPAGDLGELARDLVRMTALRNRTTMMPDTVGGPIDVAVLTRHHPVSVVQQPSDLAGAPPRWE